jgi:RHS repeat-associated protein
MTTFLHQRAMKHFFTFVLFTLASTAAFANNLTPVAVLGTEPAYPLTVVYQDKTVLFTAAASYDPDASNLITAREWKIGSTGAAVAGTGSTFTVTFTGSNGLAANETSKPFTVYLRVKDNEGTWSSWKSLTVTLKRQQDSGSVYYLTDHIGNVRATVDHNGNLLGWDDYYPFGGVMPGRSMNAANPNDLYKFTGHERDAESGIDYMLARNYDPEIGRFLSVDPSAANYPGWSPYHYSANNPINITDPTGKDWYKGNDGSVMWRKGSEAIEGYQNLGASFTQNFGTHSIRYNQNESVQITENVLSPDNFSSQMKADGSGTKDGDDGNCFVQSGRMVASSGAVSEDSPEKGLTGTAGNAYLDSEINKGNSARVEVDRTGDGRGDHWVAISSRTTDIKTQKAVSYGFYDPGTRHNSKGTAGSFTVSGTTSLSGSAPYKNTKYNVVQVRQNKK